MIILMGGGGSSNKIGSASTFLWAWYSSGGLPTSAPARTHVHRGPIGPISRGLTMSTVEQSGSGNTVKPDPVTLHTLKAGSGGVMVRTAAA